MVSHRAATVEDLFSIQDCNLCCLPENYQIKYYFYHALSWPQLLHLAEDSYGKTVGYVLAKMEDTNLSSNKDERHGHITSLAVLRSHRKMNIASKLMKSTHAAMQDIFNAEYVSLHVRVTNRAAFSLYNDVLGYSIHDIEDAYYADREDAFSMQKLLQPGIVKRQERDKKKKGRRGP
eukprot:Selendium_serpulae@DN2946_c0_g1_i2.p2